MGCLDSLCHVNAFNWPPCQASCKSFPDWVRLKTKPELCHLATSSNSLTQNVKHNLRMWTFVPNPSAKFAAAEVSMSFTTNKWSIIYIITLQQQHKAYRSKRRHIHDIELRLVSGVHTWMQMCLYAWTKQISKQKYTDNPSHRCLKMHMHQKCITYACRHVNLDTLDNSCSVLGSVPSVFHINKM